MPFRYNLFSFLVCVALRLPQPLSGECLRLAEQLEEATEGSDEHADLSTKLDQYEAWNEWGRVSQTYFLLLGKTNSPRKFFMYWRDSLRQRLQNDAHRLQYDLIARAIRRKGADQKYTKIDIHALIDGFINPQELEDGSGGDGGAEELDEDTSTHDGSGGDGGAEELDEDTTIDIGFMNDLQSGSTRRRKMFRRRLWDSDNDATDDAAAAAAAEEGGNDDDDNNDDDERNLELVGLVQELEDGSEGDGAAEELDEDTTTRNGSDHNGATEESDGDTFIDISVMRDLQSRLLDISTCPLIERE
jgi:hypothetical protein